MNTNGIENANREQWSSRLGFILASMGSAVGLGNIWRFAGEAGLNGGAAFLIIYFLCILLIGVPVMMAEFMIGRKAQSDVVGSFQKIAPQQPWFIAGIIGIIAAFAILSFYGVVAGWALKYLFAYATGGLWSTPAEGYGVYFDNFISSNSEPIIWQFIFMVLTIGIVVLGVKKGIETSNKILMPILGLLLVLMAIYSLSLGGTREALVFLFTIHDVNAFTDPEIYIRALGQAFFSLSLGMGALITFGGYLSQKEKLPGATASIISLDTVFSIVAGLVIFPAVFAFQADVAVGPSLAFVTLPGIFEQLGGVGIVVGFFFFFLLCCAAITSAVSLLEVAVAYFMRKFSLSRKVTAILIGTIIFFIGVPSALSLDVLNLVDTFSAVFLLPIGGLLIALFVGWAWNKADVIRESDLGGGFLGNLFYWTLVIVPPIGILAVFIFKLAEL